MKTTITLLLMLMLAVGLAAVTELVDFNDTANLISLFNPGATPAFTNLSTGGLGNSGAVSIPDISYAVWTRKKGFAVPALGETATLSAYFQISGNYGYSGLGFAQADANEQYDAMITSSSAIGMIFHGGGGYFANNDVLHELDWYLSPGDLVEGEWYKMIFTVTYQGANAYDVAMQIWNSDSDGVLGTLFTSQSQTGLVNPNFAALSTMYPYFTNSRSRSGYMDNFETQATEFNATTLFSGAGEGTPANPYVITTPAQLDETRNFLSSSFILGNDIDLNVSPYNTGRGWEAIGTQPNDYTILDLSGATGGTFSITAYDTMAEMNRTTLPISFDATAEAIQYALTNGYNLMAEVTELGANVFGIADIESINTASLEGIVDIQSVEQYPFSGVFNGNGKTINNLYINRTYGRNQGLFGSTSHASILNLTLSNVNVTGTMYVGGLAGYVENTTINNCHSNGDILGFTNTGGLLGNIFNGFDNVVSNCSSSGTVTSVSLYGGLIGVCNGTPISTSFSTSDMTGLGNGYIGGGLVGALGGATVNNCYATGSISTIYGGYLGGLIGMNFGEVYNSYSIGAILGSTSYKGGLFAMGEDTATGCYWNTETSGQEYASGGVTYTGTMGRTTSEMTYPYAANTCEGWDFANVWRVDATHTLNNGYPCLLPPDYLNALGVTAGETVITVTGGNANAGTGFIPEINISGFTPTQTFTFVGTGNLTITIATLAQMGAYWQSGEWHTVLNSGGQVVFEIDFNIRGTVEIPVVLGDGSPTLPVELSSFNAVQTTLNYVQLNWTTQSETGVVGYYVYRSATDDLSMAAGVSALIDAANTSQVQSYSFVDTEVSPGTWYYWLQNLDMDGSSNYHGPVSVILTEDTISTPDIPLITSLNNIYPNPFNPSTTISYGLAKAEKVNIQIFNIKGQLVRNLLSEPRQIGNYRIVWNGTDDRGQSLGSGMYFMKMTAGKYSKTSKVIMLK